MTASATLVNIATVATPLLVGAVAFVQWRISEGNKARRFEADRASEARKRDVELLKWGNAAISCMSEVETLCEFWPARKDSALRLVAEASALVDQGRLFFPNVPKDARPLTVKSSGSRGWRVAILDELVRAYLLAKMGAEGSATMHEFKPYIRAARRRFVRKLQHEMGPSLRQSPRESVGDSVSADPRQWPLES